MQHARRPHRQSAPRSGIEARGRNMMCHDVERQRVGQAEPRAGEREPGSGALLQPRQEISRADIGEKPMPTSGIAKVIFSAPMRWLPWTDSPTPPPMTMPSIRAT